MSLPSPIALQIPDFPVPVKLYAHGEQDKYVSRRIRQEGIWEPYETSLVLSLLQPGEVFVDVGANIGYFSILAAPRLVMPCVPNDCGPGMLKDTI